MNPNAHNPSTGGAEPGSAEETLRLIASLPAPEGLELRVRMGLSTHTRPGRVLAWPMPIQRGFNVRGIFPAFWGAVVMALLGMLIRALSKSA